MPSLVPTTGDTRVVAVAVQLGADAPPTEGQKEDLKFTIESQILGSTSSRTNVSNSFNGSDTRDSSAMELKNFQVITIETATSDEVGTSRSRSIGGATRSSSGRWTSVISKPRDESYSPQRYSERQYSKQQFFLNDRSLSDENPAYVWEATFDLVTTIEDVAAVTGTAASTLTSPSFLNSVTSSLNATVDIDSVVTVVATRKPSPLPTLPPTYVPTTPDPTILPSSEPTRSPTVKPTTEEKNGSTITTSIPTITPTTLSTHDWEPSLSPTREIVVVPTVGPSLKNESIVDEPLEDDAHMGSVDSASSSGAAVLLLSLIIVAAAMLAVGGTIVAAGEKGRQEAIQFLCGGALKEGEIQDGKDGKDGKAALDLGVRYSTMTRFSSSIRLEHFLQFRLSSLLPKEKTDSANLLHASNLANLPSSSHDAAIIDATITPSYCLDDDNSEFRASKFEGQEEEKSNNDLQQYHHTHRRPTPEEWRRARVARGKAERNQDDSKSSRFVDTNTDAFPPFEPLRSNEKKRERETPVQQQQKDMENDPGSGHVRLPSSSSSSFPSSPFKLPWLRHPKNSKANFGREQSGSLDGEKSKIDDELSDRLERGVITPASMLSNVDENNARQPVRRITETMSKSSSSSLWELLGNEEDDATLESRSGSATNENYVTNEKIYSASSKATHRPQLRQSSSRTLMIRQKKERDGNGVAAQEGTSTTTNIAPGLSLDTASTGTRNHAFTPNATPNRRLLPRSGSGGIVAGNGGRSLSFELRNPAVVESVVSDPIDSKDINGDENLVDLDDDDDDDDEHRHHKEKDAVSVNIDSDVDDFIDSEEDINDDSENDDDMREGKTPHRQSIHKDTSIFGVFGSPEFEESPINTAKQLEFPQNQRTSNGSGECRQSTDCAHVYDRDIDLSSNNEESEPRSTSLARDTSIFGVFGSIRDVGNND